MKNRIENIKQQYKDEGKKSLLIVIGFASGLTISKGMNYLTEKYPEVEPFVKYARPILLSGGGLLISSATTKDEHLKYLGYGVSIAGALEGIKLIPVAKEFLGLSGINQDMPTTYYTESNSNNLDLGSFGINALPVKSFSVENAPSYKIDLPDLEGVGKTNLGYNGDATSDADSMKCII